MLIYGSCLIGSFTGFIYAPDIGDYMVDIPSPHIPKLAVNFFQFLVPFTLFGGPGYQLGYYNFQICQSMFTGFDLVFSEAFSL